VSSVLLSQTVEDYLTARRVRYSATTVTNESHVLRRFVATQGDIQMRHLTPEHVETWFVSLMQPHTDRSGVHRPAIQPSSHNYYLARLKSLFRVLHQERLDPSRPAGPRPTDEERQADSPAALAGVPVGNAGHGRRPKAHEST
jgi:hypothetical protein